MTLFFGLVGLYLAAVCVIGLTQYHKTQDEAGFLVAGRTLGPVVGGATLMANQVSAGTTIGIVGFHYFSGISYAWTWPLVWVGWLVAAIFVAPKMRDFAGVTLPDFFAVRFGGTATRLLAAISILVVYTVLLTAQFQAGGILFGLVSGWRAPEAIALVAAITALYTVLGGMYGNAYVGLLKAGLLIGSYALAVPFLLRHLGGLQEIGAALHAIDPRLTAQWFSWRELIVISMAIGLGLAAAPYEIAAIYAMQSRRAVRLAIGWSFVFQALIGVGVLIFGLSMRVAVPYLPEPDLATPVLGLSILPPAIGMLVLLAAVVTITRTGGAILLTVASAVSHDLYGEVLKPDSTQRQRVLAGRLAVVAFTLVPAWLALAKLDLVNFVVIYAAKLMVSFFFVPLVGGLHWKRATGAGAFAGMLGGAVACLAWSLLPKPYPLGLDPAEVGVAASAALFFGVSLATATPPSSPPMRHLL